MRSGKKWNRASFIKTLPLTISLVIQLAFFGVLAQAENSIILESKTVLIGATSVTIGVYVSNDVDLTAMVLPLEIREVDASCYIANSLTFDVQGRIAASGLADLTNGPYFSPAPASVNCSGPMSDAFNLDSLGAVDFVSPDGVFWAGVNTTNSCLIAGTDGVPGSGSPSFLFTFDVSGIPGTFEIDTCCHSPANHLLFIECATNVALIPEFTKGEITIVSCLCPNYSDLNGDLTINPLDVVYAVNYVYRQLDGREQIVGCDGDNGDWNCDGAVNPVDVVWYVNFVYKGSEQSPCNPCACDPYPDNCP